MCQLVYRIIITNQLLQNHNISFNMSSFVFEHFVNLWKSTKYILELSWYSFAKWLNLQVDICEYQSASSTQNKTGYLINISNLRNYGWLEKWTKFRQPSLCCHQRNKQTNLLKLNAFTYLFSSLMTSLEGMDSGKTLSRLNKGDYSVHIWNCYLQHFSTRSTQRI